MIGIFDDSYRQVVPRWLSYKSACMLGLLQSIKKSANNILSNRSFIKAESEWGNNHNLFTAIDLIGEALILGDYNSVVSREAAEFILSYKKSGIPFLKEIACHYLEDVRESVQNNILNKKKDFERYQINYLRGLVREHPLNPIAWSDLSLFHAISGNKKKARNAMMAAIRLGKENRFVLRSAARCFLHLGEPDVSIELLRKSDMCGADPWINSAEIAIADRISKKSFCINTAKGLLENENLTSYSKSELAACMSTIEFKSGATRKGKLYYKEAILDPSENALAQIEWIRSRTNVLEDIHPPYTIPASYEAQARDLFRNEKYNACISAAEKWGHFQPFSSRPIILATYIASVCLDDDEKSISIISGALPIHRQDHMVMNNYAFSLLRIGQIENAKRVLSCIKQSISNDHEKTVILATQGLYSYRSGDFTNGEECYRRAIRDFERLKDFKSAAIAAYFWANEEKRIQGVHAAERVLDAKKRIEKQNVFEFKNKVNSLLHG